MVADKRKIHDRSNNWCKKKDSGLCEGAVNAHIQDI